jgi:hypothetical protein
MGPEIDSGFVFDFLCADVRSKLLLARCVRIRSMWMARSCLMPGDDLRLSCSAKNVTVLVWLVGLGPAVAAMHNAGSCQVSFYSRI